MKISLFTKSSRLSRKTFQKQESHLSKIYSSKILQILSIRFQAYPLQDSPLSNKLPLVKSRYFLSSSLCSRSNACQPVDESLLKYLSLTSKKGKNHAGCNHNSFDQNLISCNNIQLQTNTATIKNYPQLCFYGKPKYLTMIPSISIISPFVATNSPTLLKIINILRKNSHSKNLR